MKCKKILSAVLSGAVVLSTVYSGPMVEAAAADADQSVVPVAAYDFEGSIGEGTEALVTGLGAYGGELSFGEGRDGGQAIQLGDYGLKLNHENLGENYTVSMWVKPDTGLIDNMAVLFLGYHNPEKWTGIAGVANNGEACKVWTHDGSAYSWSEVTRLDVPTGEWTQLTLAQSGDQLSAYVNGKLIKSGGASRALVGENQDIYLGVNNWDDEFTGLVDDVKIYDQALTAEQVAAQYDGRSEEEILEEKGITVTETMNLMKGAQGQIQVTLPTGVSSAQVSYQSDNPQIASVDQSGKVTGMEAGNTAITTTVTVGAVTKTGTTSVKVTDAGSEISEEVVVEYNMAGASGNQLLDVSGHENHGTIHNPETVVFTSDQGKSVMDIQDAQSYVDLPMGIIDALDSKEQFTIEATYSRSANAGGTSWLFCFGSIPKDSGTNYLFYCPYFSFGNGQVRAGIKNSTTEKLFETGIQNQNDTYYTVNMVVNNGTITLYLDGVKIGGQLDSGFSIENDVINGGTADDILGYLGKSCWAQDTNFVGKIASFKIYNKAMTDGEVQNANPEFKEKLQQKLDEGIQTEDLLGSRNEAADQVYYDLTLPALLEEMEVVWSSSDPDVIAEDGSVKNQDQDQQVTMTATVTSGVLSVSKDFVFTVKAMDRSELDELMAQANAALEDSDRTEEEKQAIREALDAAAQIENQAEVAGAVFALKVALGTVTYEEAVVEKSTGGNPVAGFGDTDDVVYGGDPSILVDGDTVYLYVGHDVSSGDNYVMPNYFCYSTKDMKEWKFEGEIMNMQDVVWGDNNSAWAGQVMKHNGKYYLYYCSWNNQDNGRQSIGVAVSESPTGPFVDKGSALVKGSETYPESSTWNDIDPTAWIETDENGEEHIYLAWGNSKWYMCELNDDMISVKDQNGDGSISMNQDIWEQSISGMDGSFTEAPYLYRQQDENGNYYGKYYLFYAMNWREEMAYCTKDDIRDFTEPWEYGGRLMPASATANTNHPAVFDFKGKTYFIYHNGSLPWGSGYRRVTCVEEFTINEDGTIDPIQETATGLTGTASQILDANQVAIAHENWENTTNDADYPITKSVGMGISTQKNDTLWEILPGKADKTEESYISIESYNKPGLYLTARGEELVLTQDASRADSKGITQDSEAMTFRTLKGFAGYGVTLESVAMPGYFVTSEGGKLTLSQNPDLESATFTMTEETGGTEEGAVPLAVYDFENGIGEGTQALVTGLGSYSNEVVYGEGRESGKAVKLGDYGLKLAQENLGENYTVSLWVKPDGNIQTNTPVLFLGYHDPEKWVSVSGENNNSFCKVWTKDESAGLNWITVASGSIPAGEWTQLTLTQKGSTLTAYLNGVAIGSGTAARALSGENQGIYLGVNNWDAEFKGLIDDVKIYNQVLEPEEIQKENQEYYEEKLRETVEENLQQEELLGNKNASSQETLYDLALPSDLDGLPITWTSSEPSIISESGKVKNPAQATAVTLTAEVVSGILRAQKSFTFTVQPMDRTALEQKLSQAQQLSISPYMTEASVDALRKAMEEAQTADSQTEADKAVKKLQKAMDALTYRDEYIDPFPFLEGSEPAASAQLKEKDGLKLFEIPASIQDMVTVSYESSSPVVASYEDGTVTALKAGTTILTTVVTAKYDGYAVRYRTKITVTAQTQGTQKPPVTDPGNDQAKPAPDLSKVVVKAAKTKLAKGGSTKVNVTLPSDVQAASPKVTYKANGAVTVTSAGKIRAKKPGKGTVTVTVTADGRSISKKLSISVGAITGKSSVKAGKAIALKVKGITGKVKWSVNKKKLATIGKKGKLTAKKKGKIVVTAKVAGVTMKKSIRIR